MTGIDRPAAWAVLEQALIQRRPVQARYHGQDRVLCPHALGWKNGRPKVLCYQADGTTDHGALPTNRLQRWRSMFIDDIEEPTIIDGPWRTAPNYSRDSNCIDELEIDVCGLPMTQPLK